MTSQLRAPARLHCRPGHFAAALTMLVGASAPLAAQEADTSPKQGAAKESGQEVQQVEIDPLAKEAFVLIDSDPESSVPTMEQAMRKPLQMGYFVILLIERGKAALDRGDSAAAVKYYRALVKAVPERSQSFSLLCKAYETQGDIPSAVENCRTALGKEGVTVEDNLRFVQVLLKKPPTELSPTEIEDVDAIASHLEKELGTAQDGPALANQLRCNLGLRLEDVQRLETCSKELRKLVPKDPTTIAFSWALALKKRDFEAAKSVISDAKAAGLPRHALRKMEEGLVVAREGDRGWLRNWPLLAGGVSLLGVGLFLLLDARRKRTLIARHAG